MLIEQFDKVIHAVRGATLAHYGSRLVSMAVFGSAARGTMRPDSDIDLLIVIDDLPDGRMARVGEFEAVEKAVEPVLAQARSEGVYTSLSPVFKTREELAYGSLLFLDMTDQARILYDPEDVLSDYFAGLRARLQELGARHPARAATIGCLNLIWSPPTIPRRIEL